MARPRKVSDEDVYLAAQRVMSRVGPAELTLAAIADEAGVTAGALVQRFGSKRELLVAMSALLGSGMSEIFAQLRQRHGAPLRVVRAYAECMADMAQTPAALLRNFAYLQADLADPDIRKRLVVHSKAVQRELAALLSEAIDRRELARDTDAAALARNVEALVSGALLSWAVHRQGTAAAWIRRHVDALIAPHLTDSGRRSASA